MANKALGMVNAGSSVASVISTSTAGAITQVKSAAGFLYALDAVNIDTTTGVFAKIFDSASPGMSTDTPVMNVYIPVSGTKVNIDLGGAMEGIKFSNGIGVGITSGAAIGATAPPAANEVVVNVVYK